MRTMCVWFRDWSLGRPDAPDEGGCIVVGSTTPHPVVAATSDVIGQGVEVGMPRRRAESSCPSATVLVRDLGEETRRFEPVARALEEIIPRIEVVEPGTVMVPIAGAVSYYGTERAVVDVVIGKLPDDLGASVRVGVADGPFAAEWAARSAGPEHPMIVEDTRSFLADLDIASVTSRGAGAEGLAATFRWLGITTLGALADMPREAIASRFGADGVTIHRLAHGEDRRVDPRAVPPEMAVEMRFDEEPLRSADQVAFVARAISARLVPALRREGTAPHRVAVEIEAADGTVRRRVWSSADPFDEARLTDRVRWQIRAWIDDGSVPGGVVRITVDPTDLSGSGRQLGLFVDVAAEAETERALARAQALLGHDAVLQAEPSGGRLPSERVAWRRWGEPPVEVAGDVTAPWPGSTPAPAPALVPDPPRPVQVEWDAGSPVRIRLGSRWEPVLTWSGPWRTTGRWWDGRVASDRYQLVTSAGAFLCVYAAGSTFLVGIYD